MIVRSAHLAAAAGLLAGILAVALVPADRLFVHHQPAADGQASAGRFACPMLCVITDHGGPCPVCGMTMTAIESGRLTRVQQERMGLRTVRVERGPATAEVRAYGVVEYDHRFTRVVIARVSGRIVKRHDATYGCCQDVAQDEPIIDLYSPEAFRAQGELKAALASGDRALADALEQRFARWNLAHVAAAVKAGAEPVDTVTLRSPYAGQALLDDQTMVNRTLMVGAQIADDTPLLTLVDIKRLALVVKVPEARAHLLRNGQRVLLSSDVRGDLPEVEAVVGRAANEIDLMSRTREVRIYLADGRRHLAPGALVQARIQAALGADLGPADPADRSTWGEFALVPRDAILSTGVRHLAWKVEEREQGGRVRFEPVNVALGPRLESPDGRDRYVVRAGLAPGDEIAEQGLFLVDSQAQLAGSASLINPVGIAAPAAPAGHQGH